MLSRSSWISAASFGVAYGAASTLPIWLFIVSEYLFTFSLLIALSLAFEALASFELKS